MKEGMIYNSSCSFFFDLAALWLIFMVIIFICTDLFCGKG